MISHSLNDLNSFIAGWIPSDTRLCDKLITYHQDNLLKHQGETWKGVDLTVKNSIDCRLEDEELWKSYALDYLQPICELYKEKYPYSTDYGRWGITEHINIQHYKAGVGHYNSWHTERIDAEIPGGLRHLVFMTYLNDVAEGGETEFFHQQLKIKPEKGLTVIWPADWTFTHRGLCPSTDKYIVTGWYNFYK